MRKLLIQHIAMSILDDIAYGCEETTHAYDLLTCCVTGYYKAHHLWLSVRICTIWMSNCIPAYLEVWNYTSMILIAHLLCDRMKALLL